MRSDRRRTGAGWTALLALPVLCCAGHALVLAVGTGTVTALLGGATGSALLVIAGLFLAGLPAAFVLRRRRGLGG